MNQTISEFSDIHLHASSVREWRQTYSQITSGPLQSRLMQVASPRVHVFREQINQRVVQHGEAPRARVCFAVPLVLTGATRMQGREADNSSIFVLQGGEEFMFHMPTGMDMLAITFDRRMFESALAGRAAAGDIGTLLRQPVIKVAPQRLAASRMRLAAMFGEALDDDGTLADSNEREARFEQAMLDEVLDLIMDPACDRGQRQASSVRSFVVEKCHRLTVANSSSAPSVNDLCQRLRVSRRTVQNSFRSVAETSPVNYIRSIRLNGVRRELLSTTAPELSIGDAAARWGFFHLSHFAADYQELFGELPSQTRRRGPCAARRTGAATAGPSPAG